MVDKQALLAAVAAAGSQGRADYEAAQQQIAAQQAEAIRLALAGAASASGGAQAELQRIVSQPYQTAALHLTQNQTAQGDWFNRLGAAGGQWGDVMNGLNEAVTARALAEAAARGSGGSGGGGGGGGGGDEPLDWYDSLKDAFGTAAIAKQAIKAEADLQGLGDYENTGTSPHEALQKYAVEKYGLPAGVAAAWFPQSKEDQAAVSYVNKHVGEVKNRKQAKQFMRFVKKQNRATQGDQTYIRKQARQQVQAQLQRRRQRRRHRNR